MQALWSDLRYGARMLLKNPGFSLAAIVFELLFGRLVEGGRLSVDIDAEGQPLLDIQPSKRSDKPKAEPATA